VSRPAAKARGPIEGNFERRYTHFANFLAADRTNLVRRQRADKEQRHMQAVRCDEPAGKLVSTLQDAGEMKDFCRCYLIRYGRQKQPPNNACIATHGEIEHIINI
jgi:hypothetical protein